MQPGFLSSQAAVYHLGTRPGRTEIPGRRTWMEPPPVSPSNAQAAPVGAKSCLSGSDLGY